MSHRPTYQTNTSTTPIYISNTIQYAKPIIYPTQNIYTTAKATTTTTTNTNSNMYIYNSSKTNTNTKYYTEVKPPIYINSPHTLYYSNSQYTYPVTNTNTVYEVLNPGQINKNTYSVKTTTTTTNYGYNQRKSNPQPQGHQSGNVITDNNNIIYSEYTTRGTNFHQNNPLNLNNIYNMNNLESKNKNVKAITYENNGIQNQVAPNLIYYNNNPQNIISQTKTTKTVTYTTNTGKTSNINNNMVINYSEYPSQQINNNTINNKTINYTNNNAYKLYEEPPDNMRNKEKYSINSDAFNNTMPNLKINKELTSPFAISTESTNTIRKSNPTQAQAISNFEISFNNTPQKQFKNNVPVKTNNISFTSTTTKNNTQNNSKKIENKNDDKKNNNNNYNTVINENTEFVDQFGNVYVIINGQCIDKRALINTNKNVNQNQNVANNNINIDKNKTINTTTRTEKNTIDYKNKDNVYYEENKNNKTQNQNVVNTEVIFDSYTGTVINNPNPQETSTTTTNIIRNKDQYFDININSNQNADYFNNTYPTMQKERNNRFKEDQLNYTDINLNNNMNVNYNYNLELNQQQNIVNNTVKNIQNKKNTKGNDINNTNNTDILTVEPQKQKRRRPVYKIPPSKKRAISQGKSLAFIHKYYDENFILEEENEDNASDSENKKKKKNLKKIFRQVTNIKKIIPEWQKMKERVNENNCVEQNTNIVINSEVPNNLENKDKSKEKENNNLEKSENAQTNIEQSINSMRLSHIGFSLESTSTINNDEINNQQKNDKISVNSSIKRNIDINVDNDEENNENNLIVNSNSNNINYNINNNINLVGNTKINISQNNPELNLKIKNSSGSLSQSSKSQSGNLGENNLNTSKNSKISLEQKNSLENININSELKNSQNYSQNIDINGSAYNPSLLKESDLSSINPNFGENMMESNINLDNINIDNERKENDNDPNKRISLKISEYDLDKYFENEGSNKRDPKQIEFSSSLKTIDLNEDYNKVMSGNIEGEDQKDYLKDFQKGNVGNSNMGDSIKLQGKESGDNLLMLDDALKGSVHIPENIQNFVNKNNELYNNKSEK